MQEKPELFKDSFVAALKVTLTLVGPESVLAESSFSKGRRQFIFEDDLKCDFLVFCSGVLVKKYLPLEKDRVNQVDDIFLNAIFEETIRLVYRRLKPALPEIKTTLSHYLKDDDIDFALETFLNLLKQSFAQYRVFLLTNLIELADIESVDIGWVQIKRLDVSFIRQLPEQFLANEVLFPPTILGLGGPKTPEEFLNNHKEEVLLSFSVSGYHFKQEKSWVFERALEEFKLVFAYLLYAKHFLEHVKKTPEEEALEFKTKSLPQSFFSARVDKKGAQKYFLLKHGDAEYFEGINSSWMDIFLSQEILCLDAKILDRFKKGCCLQQFNSLVNNSSGGQIKDKVRRSFEWFLKASLDTDRTDVALSLFISLETLMSLGSDSQRGITNEIAENVAILVWSDSENRYKEKRKMREILHLRNKIVHEGRKIEIEDSDQINSLKTNLVWSLRGLLSVAEEIAKKYGVGAESIREYFDRQKLSSHFDFFKTLKLK